MKANERMKQRRIELGLTLEQVGNYVGVSKSTVRKWETGYISNMRRDKIAKLSQILQLSPLELVDDSLAPEKEAYSPLPSNVINYPEPGKVPLVGQIACGEPILAEQNIEEYVDLPKHIKADYALLCKGDSMIDLGIRDGAIVYIRSGVRVENGQVAAVSIDDDEATLKRFYRNDDIVTLVAANSRIAPKTFAGEEISRLRILGLAVAYTQTVE